MIDFRCACGAPIRMPDSAAGRRATCTTCGVKLVVPSPALEPAGAPSDDDLLLAPEPTPRPVTRLAPAMEPAPPRHSQYTTPSRVAFEDARQARRARGYWADAGYAFVSVLTVRSFLSFALLAIALAGSMLYLLYAFSGHVGARTGRRAGGGLVLLSLGALFLYAYEIIVSTAYGEDEMPTLLSIEELREDLWPALGSLAATVGFLLIPSIVAGLVMMANSTPEDTVVVVLACTGGASVLFFPVAILAVALGGVSVLWRFDLLVRTVVAAPLPYLGLLVSLAVAAALAGYLGMAVLNNPANGGFVLFALLGAVLTYFVLVSARQIGLFYRHFSDRFPWTAG